MSAKADSVTANPCDCHQIRHFIIASHGKFAEGIMDSVRLISGEVEHVRCFCAFTNPEDNLEEKVDQYLSEYAEDDEIVVVADMLGGSVCNEFVRHLTRPNLHILAGMNLGLLLELFIHRNEPVPGMIEAAVNFAQTSVCYCNRLLNEMMNDLDNPLVKGGEFID
jgi:fructoselysine and glucoselysine-specific PTS system IIA component